MNAEQIRSRIVSELAPFRDIFDAFTRAGFSLYAVGGCVRDWLMGATPKDIDFTTDAVPTDIKRILSDNHYKVIPVGEAFGTIATLIAHKTYEITTFRVKESYTRGSRHPVVCYGKSLQKDLERRDLTINAMAADADGNLIDPFDGVSDLQNRCLRVPNSSPQRAVEIFTDDPLRILRLARFKARLGFSVHPDATRAASRIAAEILSISRERWFAEIDGLLNAKAPEDGFRWLSETGVLSLILPESAALSRITIDSQSAWDLTLQRLCLLPNAHDLRWCALFSLLGAIATSNPDTIPAVNAMLAAEICARFRLSAARTHAILTCLTPLPSLPPTYRSARELALSLGVHLEHWLTFTSLYPQTLTQESLDAWKNALQPYRDHPDSADIHLPADLSARLKDELGVSGKTLGLYIAHCRDAVLDQLISESATTCEFVDFCKRSM